MADEKAENERTIFRQFLECEGAPSVVLDSIQSRNPPEPDILCHVDDVGLRAFELVQLVERDWARLVMDHIRMEKFLYSAHDGADSPQKQRLARLYEDALLYVRYKRDTTVKQRESMIPTLFDFLTTLPPAVTGDVMTDPKTKLGEVVGSIGITRTVSEGPFFQVEAVASIGDPTLYRIQEKWSKRYETDHPIDLLAYYALHPTIPAVVWTATLKAFLRERWDESPFVKVWVIDAGSRQILFTAARP